MPPLRPASRASAGLHSCAVPFWCAALPPLLAISRCFCRSIDAKPRSVIAMMCSVLAGRALSAYEVGCNGGAAQKEQFQPGHDVSRDTWSKIYTLELVR